MGQRRRIQCKNNNQSCCVVVIDAQFGTTSVSVRQSQRDGLVCFLVLFLLLCVVSSLWWECVCCGGGDRLPHSVTRKRIHVVTR